MTNPKIDISFYPIRRPGIQPSETKTQEELIISGDTIITFSETYTDGYEIEITNTGNVVIENNGEEIQLGTAYTWTDGSGTGTVTFNTDETMLWDSQFSMTATFIANYNTNSSHNSLRNANFLVPNVNSLNLFKRSPGNAILIYGNIQYGKYLVVLKDTEITDVAATAETAITFIKDRIPTTTNMHIQITGYSNMAEIALRIMKELNIQYVNQQDGNGNDLIISIEVVAFNPIFDDTTFNGLGDDEKQSVLWIYSGSGSGSGIHKHIYSDISNVSDISEIMNNNEPLKTLMFENDINNTFIHSFLRPEDTFKYIQNGVSTNIFSQDVLNGLRSTLNNSLNFFRRLGVGMIKNINISSINRNITNTLNLDILPNIGVTRPPRRSLQPYNDNSFFVNQFMAIESNFSSDNIGFIEDANGNSIDIDVNEYDNGNLSYEGQLMKIQEQIASIPPQRVPAMKEIYEDAVKNEYGWEDVVAAASRGPSADIALGVAKDVAIHTIKKLGHAFGPDASKEDQIRAALTVYSIAGTFIADAISNNFNKAFKTDVDLTMTKGEMILAPLLMNPYTSLIRYFCRKRKQKTDAEIEKRENKLEGETSFLLTSRYFCKGQTRTNGRITTELETSPTYRYESDRLAFTRFDVEGYNNESAQARWEEEFPLLRSPHDLSQQFTSDTTPMWSNEYPEDDIYINGSIKNKTEIVGKLLLFPTIDQPDHTSDSRIMTFRFPGSYSRNVIYNDDYSILDRKDAKTEQAYDKRTLEWVFTLNFISNTGKKTKKEYRLNAYTKYVDIKLADLKNSFTKQHTLLNVDGSFKERSDAAKKKIKNTPSSVIDELIEENGNILFLNDKEDERSYTSVPGFSVTKYVYETPLTKNTATGKWRKRKTLHDHDIEDDFLPLYDKIYSIGFSSDPVIIPETEMNVSILDFEHYGFRKEYARKNNFTISKFMFDDMENNAYVSNYDALSTDAEKYITEVFGDKQDGVRSKEVAAKRKLQEMDTEYERAKQDAIATFRSNFSNFQRDIGAKKEQLKAQVKRNPKSNDRKDKAFQDYVQKKEKQEQKRHKRDYDDWIKELKKDNEFDSTVDVEKIILKWKKTNNKTNVNLAYFKNEEDFRIAKVDIRFNGVFADGQDRKNALLKYESLDKEIEALEAGLVGLSGRKKNTQNNKIKARNESRKQLLMQLGEKAEMSLALMAVTSYKTIVGNDNPWGNNYFYVDDSNITYKIRIRPYDSNNSYIPRRRVKNGQTITYSNYMFTINPSVSYTQIYAVTVANTDTSSITNNSKGISFTLSKITPIIESGEENTYNQQFSIANVKITDPDIKYFDIWFTREDKRKTPYNEGNDSRSFTDTTYYLPFKTHTFRIFVDGVIPEQKLTTENKLFPHGSGSGTDMYNHNIQQVTDEFTLGLYIIVNRIGLLMNDPLINFKEVNHDRLMNLARSTLGLNSDAPDTNNDLITEVDKMVNAYFGVEEYSSGSGVNPLGTNDNLEFHVFDDEDFQGVQLPDLKSGIDENTLLSVRQQFRLKKENDDRLGGEFWQLEFENSDETLNMNYEVNRFYLYTDGTSKFDYNEYPENSLNVQEMVIKYYIDEVNAPKINSQNIPSSGSGTYYEYLTSGSNKYLKIHNIDLTKLVKSYEILNGNPNNPGVADITDNISIEITSTHNLYNSSILDTYLDIEIRYDEYMNTIVTTDVTDVIVKITISPPNETPITKYTKIVLVLHLPELQSSVNVSNITESHYNAITLDSLKTSNSDDIETFRIDEIPSFGTLYKIENNAFVELTQNSLVEALDTTSINKHHVYYRSNPLFLNINSNQNDTFKVTAINDDGVESQQQCTVSIEISPFTGKTYVFNKHQYLTINRLKLNRLLTTTTTTTQTTTYNIIHPDIVIKENHDNPNIRFILESGDGSGVQYEDIYLYKRAELSPTDDDDEEVENGDTIYANGFTNFDKESLEGIGYYNSSKINGVYFYATASEHRIAGPCAVINFQLNEVEDVKPNEIKVEHPDLEFTNKDLGVIGGNNKITLTMNGFPVDFNEISVDLQCHDTAAIFGQNNTKMSLTNDYKIQVDEAILDTPDSGINITMDVNYLGDVYTNSFNCKITNAYTIDELINITNTSVDGSAEYNAAMKLLNDNALGSEPAIGEDKQEVGGTIRTLGDQEGDENLI